MKYRALLLPILPVISTFVFAACAGMDEQPAQPPQDPTKEQIILLQKQLLELQKNQNEMDAKLQESYTTIDALNAKIQTLEERRRVAPQPEPVVVQQPAPAQQIEPAKKPQPAPAKKKPVKKKAKKKKKPQAQPQKPAAQPPAQPGAVQPQKPAVQPQAQPGAAQPQPGRAQ